MEKELFSNLMESVQQAIDYEKGDVTKARSMYVGISDDEVDPSYLIYEKVAKMSDSHRQRVAGYIDCLIEAATG